VTIVAAAAYDTIDVDVVYLVCYHRQYSSTAIAMRRGDDINDKNMPRCSVIIIKKNIK